MANTTELERCKEAFIKQGALLAEKCKRVEELKKLLDSEADDCCDWLDGKTPEEHRECANEKVRALRQRVEELVAAHQESVRIRAELGEELADTKKHLNYYMGRTAQAEAKLARVVEVLERCQCNTGECPCVTLALAAAKGE